MITLPLLAPVVNMTDPANPRDSWPAWTDEERWGLGPEPGPILDDGPRPTAGPEFEPTADELADASALLNARCTDAWPASWPDLIEVLTVSDWDWHAEAAHEAELAASAAAEGGEW